MASEPESESEDQSESETESESEHESEFRIEFQSESESETEREPEAESETESEADSKPKSPSESETEFELESESRSKPQTEATLESESEGSSETSAESKLPNHKNLRKSESETEPEAPMTAAKGSMDSEPSAKAEGRASMSDNEGLGMDMTSSGSSEDELETTPESGTPAEASEVRHPEDGDFESEPETFMPKNGATATEDAAHSREDGNADNEVSYSAQDAKEPANKDIIFFPGQPAISDTSGQDPIVDQHEEAPEEKGNVAEQQLLDSSQVLESNSLFEEGGRKSTTHPLVITKEFLEQPYIYEEYEKQNDHIGWMPHFFWQLFYPLENNKV